ncbi:MAG: T9SS type A sorting domain-containing protein [Bacteroidota bacterium]|nr:T9SS type A sorting domain-containing protein [Bacteroidota bacterium]
MKLYKYSIFILLFVLSNVGVAQWSSNPAVNNPICTFTNDQRDQVLCSDGDNGAIIAWKDKRTDAGDIYTQRIDKNGSVRWNTNGVALCTTMYEQLTPKIISDGKGGAIIVWDDRRTGVTSGNIYAQRVDANGQVFWATNGVAVKAGLAYTTQITTDGAGGAIIAWRDDRSGGMDHSDVYAQRVDSSGNIMWTSTGVAIATATSVQYPSCMVSDDSGGAIIIWTHVRTDATRNLFAQRVNAAGTKMWATAGVAIANLTTSSQIPTAQPDKQGGVFIIWEDSRGPSHNRKFYGQHLNASGVNQWIANGKRLTSETQDLSGYANFIVDGSNGLIFVYSIYISYYDNHIMAQRVSNNGTVLWDTLGVPICSRKWARSTPEIINDANGGAIMAWHCDRTSETADYPGYLYDIYAQRVDTSGNILWATNGVPVSTATNAQSFPKIIPIDGGGAILTWADYRGGGNLDIYAQRLNANGSITDVKTSASVPDKFELYQNYPNPFNPSTIINYQLPSVGRNGIPTYYVTLKVYNMLGQEVATLVNEKREAGRYEVEFNASTLPSGVYFYRLQTETFTETKKLLLLK